MSDTPQPSMSLASPDTYSLSNKQKLALSLGTIGFLILVLALANFGLGANIWILALSLGLMSTGIVFYAKALYSDKIPGIKNDGVWFNSISSRGVLGWLTGVFLTSFYIVLYFYPQFLGLGAEGAENTGLIALFDPLSQLLSGRNASQWFVYGALYTVAILAFGYKFMLKYKHNRYQQLRTGSVMFFQLGFAFLQPGKLH